MTNAFKQGDTTIWVTFLHEEMHRYDGAPKEVDFLRDMHRHIFHFRVEVGVTHDNRDIEFIMFKHALLNAAASGQIDLHNKSCEQMARSVALWVIWYRSNKPTGDIKVTVSEDGENGATVRYNSYSV